MPRSSTTFPVGAPTPTWPGCWRTRKCRGCLCIGARSARTGHTRCRPTGMWSPRSATNCSPVSTPRCTRVSIPTRLIIDPGLGFAKTAEHNWALLRALPRVCRHGHSGAGRCVPQAFPRNTAGRSGRRTATTGRAGDRHRGDLRAGRPARGVGCAGARRARLRCDALHRCSGRGGSEWLTESSCAA